MAARRSNGNAIVPIGQGGPKLPANFREKFSKFMNQQSASTPVSGGIPTVRTDNGLFIFPGSSQGEESFDGVVLCALRANSYWSEGYTPGDSSPPVCTAVAKLGESENAMAPGDGVQERQSETCFTCVRNVAPRKKCRNGLHLAVIHASQANDPKAVEKASIVRVRLSSTAIQPFSQVVGWAAEEGIPLFALGLRFTQIQPEGSTYWTTRAEPFGTVSEKVALALSERVEEGAKLIVRAAEPAPLIGGTDEKGGFAPLEGGAADRDSTPAKPRRRTTKKGTRRKL